MMTKYLLIVAFVGLTGTLALGQSVFEKYLPDPEMVFAYRDEIELTDRQAQLIRSDYETNLVPFQAMKLELDQKVREMAALLEEMDPDKEEAMALMSEMMVLETKIKTLRLETLLAVQEALTLDQREYLRKHKPDGARDWEPTFRIDPMPDVKITLRDRRADSKNPLILLRVDEEFYKMSRLQLGALDTNEIELIEVVKDNAALEAFGREARDGVIVLQLKTNRIPRGAKKFERG
ncbi:MAG: hypothetical protein AAFQ98_16425 [Bacteroidota bacterium]